MAGSTQSELGKLQALWDACRAQTDQKTTLITNLFKHIEDLSEKLYEAESELEDRKAANKFIRETNKDLQAKYTDLNREKDRHAFAALLIDGDSVLFKDELVKQGLEGGKKAASLLKLAIEENLSLQPPIHHLQVVIRVYANVRGLSKTYKEAGILDNASLFDEFVRGVNMGYPLCDYVDAGDGKECSDEKVKAMFKLYFDDMHCRHIFFGGSADNGYARMLEPYLQSEADRSRITLVEGSPFAPELARIKDRFRTLSFPDILRSQKVIAIRITQTPAPVQTPASSGYASAASKAPARQPTPTAPRAPSPRKEEGIPRNQYGERVDPPIKYSLPDYHDIKALKKCNNYHLLGHCYNGSYCSHEHGPKLNNRELAALRAIARTNPCNSGLDCDDPECINGHRCIKQNCIKGICRFSRAMHDVDTRIVSR